MSEDVVNVGVAELKVADSSSVLASFGLGSCVAVAMFDPLKKIGGLAHVMLPDSRGKDAASAPGKFADTAIGTLYDRMIDAGARRHGIRCKIVGGSQMFEVSGRRENGTDAGKVIKMHIGARNVEAVKQAICELGLPLVGEDTGGNYGRTVKFDTCTGELEVSSIYHGRTVI